MGTIKGKWMLSSYCSRVHNWLFLFFACPPTSCLDACSTLPKCPWPLREEKVAYVCSSSSCFYAQISARPSVLFDKKGIGIYSGFCLIISLHKQAFINWIRNFYDQMHYKRKFFVFLVHFVKLWLIVGFPSVQTRKVKKWNDV